MRKATVVYLADSMNVPEDLDEARALASVGLDPEWSVLSASRAGYWDLGEAARHLVVRGAKSVQAVKATVGEDGRLHLFGQPIRVFG